MIDHKIVSRRFFERVCTNGNLDVINDLVTDDAVHRDRDEAEYHGPDPRTTGGGKPLHCRSVG